MSGLDIANTGNGNCDTNTLDNVSQAFAISNLAIGEAVRNLTATFTFTPTNGAVLTTLRAAAPRRT